MSFKAARQLWVVDITWSDMWEELREEAREMWQDYGLRNDVCIAKFEEDDWYEVKEGTYPYPKIGQYIKENIPEGEEVWIHWWW